MAPRPETVMAAACLAAYWLIYAALALAGLSPGEEVILMVYLVAGSALHWGIQGGLAAVGWYVGLQLVGVAGGHTASDLNVPAAAFTAVSMALFVGIPVERIHRRNRRLRADQARSEAEFKKARKIHRETLPETLPRVEGYSLAALYRPTSGLGGDFYTAVQRGDKLHFIISDVTGHGLDGTMLSIFIKTTLDNYLILEGDESSSPATFLNYLTERFLSEQYPGDLFICILLGILDLKSHELTYASAGLHIPLLLVSGRGEFRELPVGNLPISPAVPREMIAFEEVKAEMRPGTIICMASDGIHEQKKGGKLYSRRLGTVLKRSHQCRAEEIVQEVERDFGMFNGGLKADDDITLMIIKRHPGGVDKKRGRFDAGRGICISRPCPDDAGRAGNHESYQ